MRTDLPVFTKGNLRCLVAALGPLIAGAHTAADASASLGALSGQVALGSGAGVTFTGFEAQTFLALDNRRQIAFAARLAGSGESALNDIALYVGANLLACEGGAAPGLAGGVKYGHTSQQAFPPLTLGAAFLDNPALSRSGNTGYIAFLSGPGAPVQTLFLNGLPAVRTGDAITGAPTGISLGAFADPVVNESGQTAYRSYMDGYCGVSTCKGIVRDASSIALTGSVAPTGARW